MSDIIMIREKTVVSCQIYSIMELLDGSRKSKLTVRSTGRLNKSRFIKGNSMFQFISRSKTLFTAITLNSRWVFETLPK